jgi:CheY-like chemotaxis protein
MYTQSIFSSSMEQPSIGMWVDMCFQFNKTDQEEFLCTSISTQNNFFTLPLIFKNWLNKSLTSSSTEYLDQIFYQLIFSALDEHPVPLKFFHRIEDQIWSLYKYSISNDAINFKFTIVKNPFVKQPEVISSNVVKPYLDNLKGLKVLIVDDNQISVLITKKILESAEAEVFCAENGLNAIALCQAAVFDVILMDIHMPQLSGFQTSSLIRQIELNNSTPIVAFTTSSYYEVKNELYDAGMNEFIQKPFKAEELQSKIFMLVNATRKAV